MDDEGECGTDDYRERDVGGDHVGNRRRVNQVGRGCKAMSEQTKGLDESRP